jgi:hypothetical protein
LKKAKTFAKVFAKTKIFGNKFREISRKSAHFRIFAKIEKGIFVSTLELHKIMSHTVYLPVMYCTENFNSNFNSIKVFSINQ